MTILNELSKESLAIHLHEAITQCLTEEPSPSAWIVNGAVLSMPRYTNRNRKKLHAQACTEWINQRLSRT